MKLSDQVADLKAKLKMREDAYDALVRERNQAIAQEKGTRAQFDDLKERLRALEIENATMRGYIDRAQEDDHAREELVATGDPHGAQQLVPKRKHRLFPMHQVEYGGPAGGHLTASEVNSVYERTRNGAPRAKHWVNY